MISTPFYLSFVFSPFLGLSKSKPSPLFALAICPLKVSATTITVIILRYTAVQSSLTPVVSGTY